MAEHPEQSHAAGTGIIEPSPEFPKAQVVFDSLKKSEQLRSLGLADRSEEVLRSVLCALWRTTPLGELDLIRGLLPGGIDLLFVSCERPHGRHKAPDTFHRDALVEDVAGHLQVSRDQALAASNAVFDVLRGCMVDEDVSNACVYLSPSSEFLALLRRPT